MLINSAQFCRSLGGLIIFLFIHRQEIVLQSGFFELQGGDFSSDAIEKSRVRFIRTYAFYLQFLLNNIIVLGELDSLKRGLPLLDVSLQFPNLLLKGINERHKLLNLHLSFPPSFFSLLPHIIQVHSPFLKHPSNCLMYPREFQSIGMDELLLQLYEPAEKGILALHPSVLCLQIVHFALEEFGKAAVLLLQHGHFLFQWKSYSIIDRSISLLQSYNSKFKDYSLE